MKSKPGLTFLLVVVLLISSSSALHSQEYIPTAVEGAQWIVKYDDIDTPQLVDGLWEYYSGGDTSVDNHIYKKVYKRFLQPTDAAPPFEPGGSYNLSGLIRDDTLNRKVFAILFDDGNMFCPVEEEILLFDFSYATGDTATFCLVPDFVDFTIESITLNTHLGFDTRIFANEGAYEYYEGMGTYFGLFEPMFMPIKSSNNRSPNQTFLYYYCREAPCQLVVSSAEIQEQENIFVIYPNPAVHHLDVIIPNTIKANQIVITNSLGQIVKRRTFDGQGSAIRIHISDLPAGIYMAGLIRDETVIMTRKILVSRPN